MSSPSKTSGPEKRKLVDLSNLSDSDEEDGHQVNSSTTQKRRSRSSERMKTVDISTASSRASSREIMSGKIASSKVPSLNRSSDSSKISCPQCTLSNPEDAEECDLCGADLLGLGKRNATKEIVCKRCTSSNTDAATACTSCGANLRDDGWIPHGFYLNEIHDENGKRVEKGPLERCSTVNIPSLCLELDDLQEAWVMTMDLNPELFFLLFPAFREISRLFVFHGMDGGNPFQRSETNKGLEKELQKVNPHTKCFHPPPAPYGRHHSKGFVLFYKDKVRLIIHTANLVAKDLFNKTDAVWYKDFELLREDNRPRGENREFAPRLFKYFRAQMATVEADNPRAKGNLPDVGALWKYDFSTSDAALIASIPGKQAPGSKEWGQLALEHFLRKRPAHERAWPAVCQFTSFGSQTMPKKYGTDACWALDEFAQRALVREANAPVHFVFPSNLDCRRSIVGYAHGLFFVNKEASAACYESRIRPRLCWWNAAAAYPSRDRAFPHMKSYFAFNPTDPRHLSWACITSANLSKAAWGKFTLKGDLSISSWELGVLIMPEFCGNRKLVAYPKTPMQSQAPGEVVVPVPIALPPAKYTAKMNDPSDEMSLEAMERNIPVVLPAPVLASLS